MTPTFEMLLAHVAKSLAEVHLRLGHVEEASASADELMELIEPRRRGIHAALVVLDHALKVVADEELLAEDQRQLFISAETARARELLRQGLELGLVVGDTLPHLRNSSAEIAQLVNDWTAEEPPVAKQEH